MSLADQIKTLETEFAEAQARIASLESSNQALAATNKALTDENGLLVMQADQLIRHSNDTRAMAEKLGNDALELLRQSRREAYKPVEVMRFAPKPEAEQPHEERVADVEGKLEAIRRNGGASSPDFQAALAPEDASVRDLVVDGHQAFAARLMDDAKTAVEQEGARLRPVREIEPTALDVPHFLRRDQVFATYASADRVTA